MHYVIHTIPEMSYCSALKYPFFLCQCSWLDIQLNTSNAKHARVQWLGFHKRVLPECGTDRALLSASLEPGMFLFTNPGARRGLLLEAGCLLPYYTRLLCGSVSKKEQHCYMCSNQQGEAQTKHTGGYVSCLIFNHSEQRGK